MSTPLARWRWRWRWRRRSGRARLLKQIVTHLREEANMHRLDAATTHCGYCRRHFRTGCSKCLPVRRSTCWNSTCWNHCPGCRAISGSVPRLLECHIKQNVQAEEHGHPISRRGRLLVMVDSDDVAAIMVKRPLLVSPVRTAATGRVDGALLSCIFGFGGLRPRGHACFI